MSDERRLNFHFAAIPDWVLEHPELDATCIRVFGLMARFSEPFPSLARIAEGGGWSVRHVRRVIRRLEAVGAVRTETRFRDNGSQTSSLYHLSGETPLSPVSEAPRTSVSASPLSPVSAPEVDKELDIQNPKPKPSRGLVLAATPPTTEDFFGQFWQAYPRKIKKPDAHKAFCQALTAHADLGEMANGLTAWVAYWRMRGQPEFIPYPATWLRARQWNDPPIVDVHETAEERMSRILHGPVNGASP